MTDGNIMQTVDFTECNPSGSQFNKTIRMCSSLYVLASITVQVYSFNSCIISSFTSINLKQMLTRKSMLTSETITETKHYKCRGESVSKAAKEIWIYSWSVSFCLMTDCHEGMRALLN